MQRKVNFLVAGTQKAATTALDSYLRLHPEICMANWKEVHFFDEEKNFIEASVNYSIYHSAFSPLPDTRLLGETTPIYMYWKTAPKRIWQYNPEMKFIIILRNPIERAYSHWNMERSKKAETLMFWDAITQEKKRCQESSPYQHRVYSYIDRGFYSDQLRNLWEYFPKKSTLIVRYENLRDKCQKVLDQIFVFLDVTKMPPFREKYYFSLPYEKTITAQEHAFLVNIFNDEVSKLETMLNWDCSNWLRKPERFNR